MLDEVTVLDRVTRRGSPTPSLPAVAPLHERIDHIGAVGLDVHRSPGRHRFEQHGHRHQLHAVVGRGGFRAGGPAVVGHEPAPAARSRIAQTRAVGRRHETVPAGGRRHGRRRDRSPRSENRFGCSTAASCQAPAPREGCSDLFGSRWALRVSNPRPPPCKGGALPTELNARRRARVADEVDRGGPGLVGVPGGGVPRRVAPARLCGDLLVLPASRCQALSATWYDGSYRGTSSSSTGSGGAHLRRPAPTPLVREHLAVGEELAAPDAPRLTPFDRGVEALVLHRALDAERLGPQDVVELLREEQVDERARCRRRSARRSARVRLR